MYYELIKALDNSLVPRCLSKLPMEVSFISGQMISNNVLESPLRFVLDHPYGEDMPDYMNAGSGMLLFSNRLVTVLGNAGVDNLQFFPASINVNNNNEIMDSYSVANIIGLIACADMAHSKYTEIMQGLYEFSHLAIDLESTRHQKLFRLAESSRRILIHEDVIRHIILNPLDPELSGFDLREIEQA